MNLLTLCQALLLILFLALTIVGSKLKKSLKQSVVYCSAFAALFTLLALLVTTRVELLLFASLWIFPVGVAGHLKVEHQRLYSALVYVGTIWFILLLLFVFFQAPLLFLPTLCILVPLLSVNKYMFTSEKASTTGFLGRLESFLRFKKRAYFAAGLPSVTPLLLALFFFLTRWSLTIQAQMLNSFYSIISQLAGTFLAIVVTMSIFLVSIRRKASGLSILLLRAAKGLCILYSVTLITSLIGLFFIPEVKFQVNLFQVRTEAIFYQTIFMVNLGMIFACIMYLVITFLEVVEVSPRA